MGHLLAETLRGQRSRGTRSIDIDNTIRTPEGVQLRNLLLTDFEGDISEAFKKSCELACAWYLLANKGNTNDSNDGNRPADLGVGPRVAPVEHTT